MGSIEDMSSSSGPPGRPSRELAYGDSIARHRFRCKSLTSGVRCVNKRNGHGFKLSRESYPLF